MRQIVVFCFACLCVGFATAQEAPSAPPENIEQRTDAIAKTLRCVVCQNQSIYDSDAPLAQDMRRLVRKRVEAGDSDADVRAYLRQRYGDYVLLTPPFQSNTWVLWLGPGVLVALLAVWFIQRARQRRQVGPIPTVTPMSEAAQARVAAALRPDGDMST